jgi:hypothetical protein
MAHGPNLFAYVGDVMGVMGRGRRDKRNGLTGMRDHLHMSTSAIALEPRFMFDAAGVATGAETLVDTHHEPITDSEPATDHALLDALAQAPAAAEVPLADMHPVSPVLREADAAANGGRLEVVFIDTALADYQTLVNGVKAGVEVVVLDGSRDGLAQMAVWAEGKVGYDAIHVLSHGAEG